MNTEGFQVDEQVVTKDSHGFCRKLKIILGLPKLLLVFSKMVLVLCKMVPELSKMVMILPKMVPEVSKME